MYELTGVTCLLECVHPDMTGKVKKDDDAS